MKVLIFLIVLSANSPTWAEPISFLGTNEEGVELSSSIDEAAYESHLRDSLRIMESTIDQNFSGENFVDNGKFRLSAIGLALGATGEIGVGPFKLGAGIRQRFVFRRQQ